MPPQDANPTPSFGGFGLRRLQVAQEAKDQERKRLAEELHDETLAELTSFILELGLLSRQPSDSIPSLNPNPPKG